MDKKLEKELKEEFKHVTESKLAVNVLMSIFKKNHPDVVRNKFNIYLGYLQKGFPDIDQGLFDSVHEKYMNYLKDYRNFKV